jgi:DNA-binding HxlR family transcriptional regulator
LKIRDEYTCPLEVVHDIIKGKWKSIILWQLKYGPTSLSKLENGISGINQKMLLEQLKELTEFGLIDKTNSNGYPLHVEYFLTDDRGKKIIPALEILQSIGVDYMVEHGMTDFLDQKGIIYSIEYPQKSK